MHGVEHLAHHHISSFALQSYEISERNGKKNAFFFSISERKVSSATSPVRTDGPVHGLRRGRAYARARV